MSKLETQILSSHGADGRKWLDELPATLKKCQDRWQLEQLVEFENLSWNYVARARRSERAVVLKLSCDQRALNREIKALKTFSGGISIEVLEYDEILGAALLESAEPGKDLLGQVSDSRAAVVVCCEVAAGIKNGQKTSSSAQSSDFSRIETLAVNLEKDWTAISRDLLFTARKLRAELFAHDHPEYLIHGDLHRGNILSHGTQWKVIDPKGYVGSIYSEVWPFIHQPATEIPLAAEKLGLDEKLLFKWCFMHSVLSATWCLADGVDPTKILGLAENLFFMRPRDI